MAPIARRPEAGGRSCAHEVLCQLKRNDHGRKLSSGSKSGASTRERTQWKAVRRNWRGLALPSELMRVPVHTDAVWCSMIAATPAACGAQRWPSRHAKLVMQLPELPTQDAIRTSGLDFSDGPCAPCAPCASPVLGAPCAMSSPAGCECNASPSGSPTGTSEWPFTEAHASSPNMGVVPATSSVSSSLRCSMSALSVPGDRAPGTLRPSPVRCDPAAGALAAGGAPEVDDGAGTNSRCSSSPGSGAVANVPCGALLRAVYAPREPAPRPLCT
mmetsp:Transcript_16235/g.42024  ORF Transcript_16235/g.42024 Transcript_16235/m.42024 type:complete len:272 (+) Transcript_16235:1695-2510(+)